MKLLVSVRDLAEVAIAAECGVDIVDVKEPNNGSLGASSPIVLRRIADVFGRSLRLSAAQGELIDYQSTDVESLCGYSYAKIGLSSCASQLDWRQRLARWANEVSRYSSPVAVGYADFRLCRAPSPIEIAEISAASGCRVFLLDTFHKQGQNLFSFISLDELRLLIEEIHALGMRFAAAGCLDAGHIKPLTMIGSDIIGVRGAACRMHSRISVIDSSRVTHLKQEINNCLPRRFKKLQDRCIKTEN